ncbi:hypothetical protein PCC6912_39530 [Chlorogloeopsis fritschii PCC 6912]|uniref:Uncharacterized protein n=1 Tax=Chlorogloeopsis fritschii PCC 6912 TaxID=211165 RepID=A0A3S0XU96_CHLFR|nr:hypothetical protein [Chlorogloeopsis fritschii]RUR76994.1 hypothetical protein PCC6912_39530 [Chlorogloeopsis fritschii PCC 6912]
MSTKSTQPSSTPFQTSQQSKSTLPQVPVKTTQNPTQTNFDYQSLSQIQNSLNRLESLFPSQTREESQQFSNQPAKDNLALQSSYARNQNLQQISDAAEAARVASGIGSQNYQAKLAADINAAKQSAGIGGPDQTRGGSAEIFGRNFVSPWAYDVDFNGTARLNMGKVAEADRRQAAAIGAIADASRAEAQGGIALAKGQAEAQKGVATFNNLLNIANMQREQAFQREQSGLERLGRERLAGIDAQSRVASSLFGALGSISSGSPNYRYWGG